MNNQQENPGPLQSLKDTLQARLDLFRKAGSFAAIGVVNSLVDFGVFVLAYQVAGLPIIPANVIAWLVAVSGSYVMNSYITFAAESGRQLRKSAYGAFVLSGVAGLVANTATVWLCSFVMPVLIGKLLAIGVSFLVNFTISHLVVFRPKKAE